MVWGGLMIGTLVGWPSPTLSSVTVCGIHKCWLWVWWRCVPNFIPKKNSTEIEVYNSIWQATQVEQNPQGL